MSSWETYTDISNRCLLVRAKVHKMPPDDLADIRQNIILHLWVCRASVAALAQEELERFIGQLAARYTKRWKRYRKKYKPMGAEHVPIVNEGELNETEFTVLRLDVAAILRYLTSRQVAICRCLMDGQTPRQIRWIVKCSQETMRTELDQIRQCFLLFDYR